MRTVLFTLIVCLTCALTAPAQIQTTAPGQFCWNSGTSDGSSSYAFTTYRTLDLHVDGYGNSYTAGYEMTQTTGSGNRTYAFVLTKFDKNGVVVWQKNHRWPSIYAVNDNFLSAYVTGITTDNNKNVYISGTFHSKKFTLDAFSYSYTTNTARAFIARLDSNGTCEWVARMEGSGNYRTASDIVFSDNKLYLTQWGSGTLYLPDGSTAFPNYPCSVVALDCFGNFIQDVPYTQQVNDVGGLLFNADQSGSFTYTNIPVNPRLELSPNGDIYFMTRVNVYATFGSITPTISSVTAGMNLKTVCARLDPAIGWVDAFYVVGTDKNYTFNVLDRIDIIPSFTVDSLNHVYYADHWKATGNPGEHENVCLASGDTLEGYQLNASCLLRFDPTGILAWQTIHSDITFSALTSCSDGFYAYGTYEDPLQLNSSNGDSLVVTVSSSLETAIICKSDSAGVLEWATTYGGGGTEVSYCMRRYPCTNNFFVTGLASGTEVIFNQSDTISVNQIYNTYILKYSPEGNCQDPECAVPNGLQDPVKPHYGSVTVCPNPVSTSFSITDLPEGVYQMEIVNPMGELIYNQELHLSGQFVWSANDLPAGVYFLRIYQFGGGVSSARFIKQ